MVSPMGAVRIASAPRRITAGTAAHGEHWYLRWKGYGAMYLSDFIQQLDSAIAECELARVQLTANVKYPASDLVRAKAKVGLQDVNYQLYRLRTLRDGLLIEREPASLLH